MRGDHNFLQRRLPDFCLLVYLVTVTVGAFTGGMWASLGIGGALIMFAAVWRIEGRAPWPAERIALILSLLWIFAILNFQSSQPKLSWHVWTELATIFLPLGLLASPAIQKHAFSSQFSTWFPLAMAIGASALGIELALQGPLLKWLRGPNAGLFQYNRGFSYLVILAFVAMASLWILKRRLLIIPFVLILLVPASLTESRAAKLALIAGLLVTFAAFLLPTLVQRSLSVLPFLAVGWPFAAQKLFLEHRDWVQHLPPSWEDRVEIWDFLSYRILEKPFFGWGLGTTPTLSPAEPHGALYHYETVPVVHPHNVVIQLWIEFGVPGLICGIIFALWVLQRIGRLPPTLMPFAAGAWMATFCIALIAYNFWSDSLWAVMALTAFAFGLMNRQLELNGSPR